VAILAEPEICNGHLRSSGKPSLVLCCSWCAATPSSARVCSTPGQQDERTLRVVSSVLWVLAKQSRTSRSSSLTWTTSCRLHLCDEAFRLRRAGRRVVVSVPGIVARGLCLSSDGGSPTEEGTYLLSRGVHPAWPHDGCDEMGISPLAGGAVRFASLAVNHCHRATATEPPCFRGTANGGQKRATATLSYPSSKERAGQSRPACCCTLHGWLRTHDFRGDFHTSFMIQP
jgi:hypothetical protein